VPQITLKINGTDHTCDVSADMPLLWALRDKLNITSARFGCGIGACGACTVLVDGLSVRSCLMLAVQAGGSDITTVEGIAPSEDELHPLQEAFRDNHGLQCGFCTPGILMTMKAFIAENPAASEGEIRQALSGNLCRCTGYQKIVEAVKLAATRIGGSS